MAENIREIVLDTLLTLEKGEEYSHRLIRAVLDKYSYLDSRDRAFMKRLAEGSIERRIELDYYLDHISSLPVRKMKPLIRCLLRMSACQILYMDTVPDSAVCNEAVKLAGKRGFRSLKGFVNGVLRNLSRQKEALPLPDENREPVTFLSVKYSMPAWLVQLWLSGYGREVTENMLAGLMRIHPVSLRFSTGLSDREREEGEERLRQAGVKITPGPYLPYVCSMEHGEDVRMLPGFEEGIFTVQDVSSALAVEAAQIRETDFVMDICAAPGGKSILAAEKAYQVLARDVSGGKTDMIGENIGRMGIRNVEVQVFDATEYDEKYEGKADVVLMDVPCSGLGVIGKKRDIKYHVTPEGLETLMKLQRQIVDSSWRYVKPGGTLLYSTCTIHPGENEAMVKYISEQLPFEPVSLENVLPQELWEQKRKLEAQRKMQTEQEAEAQRKTQAQQGAEAQRKTQAQQEAEAQRKTPAEHITEAKRKTQAQQGAENIPGMRAQAGTPVQLTEKEQSACIQLLPGYMECDGFFFARFRRQRSSRNRKIPCD